jgi:aryl sulfotransferase
MEDIEYPGKARWIASFPKSGNTWVRLLINGYITGHVDINHMPYTMGDLNRASLQGACTVQIEELSDKQIVQYRPAALANDILSRRYTPAMFKTHNAQLLVDGIELIPKALSYSGIYLVRDPRAVAISLAAHNGKSIDKAINVMCDDEHKLATGRSHAVHFVTGWSTHVKSWTDETQIPTLLVKYEDLVEEPEVWLPMILEAFGFKNIDKKAVKKAIKLTELSKLQKQEKEKGFKEKLGVSTKDFFEDKGNWKEMLTEKQIKRIELDHGDMMTKLNYL